MNNSPFKFLDSYTKEDKDIFFGRESEIEKLYSLVFESKTLLVYGISGTGKSSLIHCGLANKFNEADWLPINIRRGTDMLESFWIALEKTALTPLKKPEKLTAGKFNKAIQSIYLDHFKPIFFIFDQFEELFVFGSEEEQQEFLSMVKSITESDLQTRFVFVIREEYLAMFTEFESEIPTILDNRLRIEKMTRENARQAIEGPCQLFNIAVEEDFSQTLLQKLSPKQNQVELTYLQVYLDKLYRMAQVEGGEDEQLHFTKKLIDQSGNISDLLGSFLEEQITQLKDPTAGLKVLKAFVSTKGTKRQINIQEAQNYIKTLGADLPQEQISQLITQFINLRILRDKDEADRFELRHDALAAKIFEKITLAEKELLEIRQFIEHAFDNYQKREILLSQEDLDYVQPFLDKLHLPEELMGFIEESNQINLENARKQKKLSRLSQLAFFAILAFLIFQGSMYLIRYAQTNYGEGAVFTNEVAPVESLQRAIFSVQKHNTSKAKKAMLDSFDELLRRMDDVDSLTRENGKKWTDFSVVEHNCSFINIGKIHQSGLYFTVDDSLNFQLWNLNFDLLENFPTNRFPASIKISDDGSIVTIIDTGQVISVFKKGALMIEEQISFNNDFFENKFSVSPNGQFVTFIDDSMAYYFNTNKNSLQHFNTKGHRIKSLDYSQQNNICALLSADSVVLTYKMNADSIFPFSLINFYSERKINILDIEIVNNAKYLLMIDNVNQLFNIRINGLNFNFLYLGNISASSRSSLINIVGDNGLIINMKKYKRYQRNGLAQIENFEQNSSIYSFKKNDLSSKLANHTDAPIYSIKSDISFENFIFNYGLNQFKLLSNGYIIDSYEYDNVIFSVDDYSIVGVLKNQIFRVPINENSIIEYLKPYELDNISNIDRNVLHY